MSLERTETTIRLQASPTNLYHDVQIVNRGVLVPEPIDQFSYAGVSDAYVALMGPNQKIYRWSLIWDGSILSHKLLLSPNQNESSVAGVDIRYGDSWKRVSLLVGHADIPYLVVGAGAPPDAEITSLRSNYLLFEPADNSLTFI